MTIAATHHTGMADRAVAARPSGPWILGISGSLRRDSVNSAALRAAARAAGPEVPVEIVNSIAELPAFSADQEAVPPAAVRRFITCCRASAGVLMAVPEYAHGIPGSFKNALDWTVGAGVLDQKPVTVLSVAPPGRGSYAQRSLLDVLSALGCDVVHRSLPLGPHARVDADIVALSYLRELRDVVAELVQRSVRREQR